MACETLTLTTKDLAEEGSVIMLRRCRMVVECIFGRLKARWCCLPNCLDASMANAICMFVACCALHNTYEAKGKGFDMEWIQDTADLQAGSCN